MKKRAVLDNFSKALDGPATKAPVAKNNRHDLGYDSDESAAVLPTGRMLQFLNSLKTVDSDDVYFSEFQESIKILSKATPVLKDSTPINVTKTNGDIKRVIGVEREGVAIKVDKGAVSFHKRNSEGVFQETESTEEGMAIFAALYGVSEDYKSRVDNLTAADSKDSMAEERKSLNSSDRIDSDNIQVDNAYDSFIAKKISPIKETSTATLETERDSGQLSDNQSFVQGIGTPDIVSKMGDSEDGLDFSIDLSDVSRNQRRNGVEYVSSQRRGNQGLRRSYEELEISKEGQTSFDNQQQDFSDESSILSDLENISRDGEDTHVTNSRGNKSVRQFSEESYEESDVEEIAQVESSDLDDERLSSPVLDIIQSPVKSRDSVVKDDNSEIIQDGFKTPLVEGSKKSDLSRSSSNSYEDSSEEEVNQSQTPLRKRGNTDNSQFANPFSSIIQSSSLVGGEGRSNVDQSIDSDDESIVLDTNQSPVKSRDSVVKDDNSEIIQDGFKTPLVEGSKKSDLSRSSSNSYEDSSEEEVNQSQTQVKKRGNTDGSQYVDQSIFVEQISQASSATTEMKTPVKSNTKLDFSNVSIRSRTPTRDRQGQNHSPSRDVLHSTSADIVGELNDDKSESYVDLPKEIKADGYKSDNRSDSLVTSEDDKERASTTKSSVSKKETPKEVDNKPESSRRGVLGKLKSLFTSKKDSSKGVFGNVKADNQESNNPFAFAASSSSVDKEDNRDGELSFPPSSSFVTFRKPVQRGRKSSVSNPTSKEESKVTHRGKSSSDINLEGAVDSSVDDFLMRERNESSSQKLDSGEMSEESNKTPVSIKSQSNTETISPKKSAIPRKSMPYRGASLSPATSISGADVMKPQAGVMPQIIECGPAGVWLDTNFVFLYENRELKTKEEVKGVAFNSLVAIIDQVTLDLQKNEKYDNMHLKIKDVVDLIDYSREIGGVSKKLNDERTGYEINEGIEEWKVKFSASFQNYCGARGFHTDKDCDIPVKLTRLPPEVYDILQGRDPEFEPIKHEENVTLSFIGVDLSPKTRNSLSPQNIGAK